MTFFASVALVFVLLIRPQEIWPVLNALHLLDVLTGLVVVGLVIDIALQREKNLYSPQLPFVVAFILIGYLLTAMNLGAAKGMQLGTARATIPAVFMLAVMYGARTHGRLRAMLWLLLLLAGFVSAVAAHQGTTHAVCMERRYDEDEGYVKTELETADGRECNIPTDCRDETREQVEWACEYIGLFQTFSAGRRVRWRGQLEDPNELSVFIGAVIPLLFAVGLTQHTAASQRGIGLQRLYMAIAVAMVGIGLYAVILSQSRGGQLVVATVFTMYFVSRFGWKGILGAAALALPVLLLGGRDDAEADESSHERLELLYEGITLFFQHPIKGVGIDQFADRNGSALHLTAHNSYLLTAAELGLPGFFAWSGIVWTSLKIPLKALKAATLSVEIRSIALALVVSFSGIAVGIFFLSFTYKQLLFVWFGLSGAFYGIMRKVDPSLEVKIGWRDLLGVFAADLAMLGFIYVYTRVKAGGGGG